MTAFHVDRSLKVRAQVNVNETNDPILDWIEERGGGYVWEPEVFAVNLLETSFDDDDAERLSRLIGVQQIAVDASKMSMAGLNILASIPGISSLVIRSDRESDDFIDLLLYTPVVIISDE